MNRVEIKEKAKKMIKGNKWYIWKPIIVIGLCIAIIEAIAFGLDYACGLIKVETVEILGVKTTHYSAGIFSSVIGIVTGFASAALAVAYAYYVLAFVRGKKMEIKDVLEFMKKYWTIAFLVGLVAGLNMLLGYVLLIIPGIMAALGLAFYREVCADNPTLKTTEILRKAWEVTKGHKMDLFVLGLSFIGWYLVAGLTLGILYIWLLPYMIVTFTLAYEELKK